MRLIGQSIPLGFRLQFRSVTQQFQSASLRHRVHVHRDLMSRRKSLKPICHFRMSLGQRVRTQVTHNRKYLVLNLFCRRHHPGQHRANQARRLASASLSLPSILRLRVGDRLPLHVVDCISAAASQRYDVIFPIAGTGADRLPCRRAGMLVLEFARYSP
jgi:hypothetical protein